MQSDIHKLSAIPGIGKKTAERLILELKEKVKKLDLDIAPSTEARRMPEEGVVDDVVSALLNLGYKEQQVRKALGGLDTSAGTSLEELLKQALKTLMK